LGRKQRSRTFALHLDQLNELRAKGVAPKLRVLEASRDAVSIFDGGK